jgi:hypothetical protein
LKLIKVTWILLNNTFGSDVDSVAIIVSAFMLGLGLGALGGGKLLINTQIKHYSFLF